MPIVAGVLKPLCKKFVGFRSESDARDVLVWFSADTAVENIVGKSDDLGSGAPVVVFAQGGFQRVEGGPKSGG